MVQKNWKIAIICLFVIISGGCHSMGAVSERTRLADSSLAAAEQSAASSLAATEDENTEAQEQAADKVLPAATEPLCYIHICGAVVNPGVYQVPEGERLFRVIEMAGGYREDAAAEYLNLAARAVDGMKLLIPTREEYAVMDVKEYEAEPEAARSDGRLNLNTATKEQLMGLSGIGEAKAEAILDYRSQHGGFDSIEEVMNISGIKQAAFDRFKDKIVVSD